MGDKNDKPDLLHDYDDDDGEVNEETRLLHNDKKILDPKNIMDQHTPTSSSSSTKTSSKEPDHPFLHAVQQGNIVAVNAHIEGGSDINMRNKQGVTPIAIAARFGHIDVVERLLQAGADITIPDNNGKTALHWAAQKGHTDVVRTLIEKNATLLNVKNNNGRTPLHLAVRNNKPAVVDVLIGKGANLNLQDNLAMTPLHGAAHRGYLDIATTLVNADADLTLLNAIKGSALHTAAHEGHIDVFKLLLDSGAGTPDERLSILEAGVARSEEKKYYGTALLLLTKGGVKASNFVKYMALRHAFTADSDKDADNHPYMRALITHGAEIEHCFHMFRVKDVPQRLITNKLIEHPEKLTPKGRLGLMEYLTTGSLPSATKDALTSDFLKQLVYGELPISNAVHPNASNLVQLLKDKNATIEYGVLRAIPHLHTLYSFFGITQLCALASEDVKVGSPKSFRLYAQVEICKLLAKCDNKPNDATNTKIAAWKAVVNTPDADDAKVIELVKSALKQNQSSVSRVFKSDPTADLPKELQGALNASALQGSPPKPGGNQAGT